jgi:hypothetical protein
MFVEVADATCLRQGDILGGIPFPRLNSAELRILGTIGPGPQPAVPTLAAKTNTHRDDANWLVAQYPARLSFCAVLSQCCYLEPRNGQVRIPAFSLARLIAIPRGIASDPQGLASLRANKDPRNTSDPGYLNFFHIPAHDRIERKEWVVDYNQTISIPGVEFPSVLSQKILQMDDQNRVKFKIKLASCLSRLTDEEREAGLENPWAAPERAAANPGTN